MARKLNTRNAESVRDKIQGTVLIKRLQDHALDKLPLPMTPTQIDAAKFLLSYAMPKPAEQQQITGELVISWKS